METKINHMYRTRARQRPWAHKLAHTTLEGVGGNAGKNILVLPSSPMGVIVNLFFLFTLNILLFRYR